MTNLICPQCSTPFVTRAPGESLQERVLSLVYVYPFRCQLCGYRFKSLHLGGKSLRVDEGYLNYQRLPVKFAATLRSEALVNEGSVVDISMGGCAIHTLARLQPGAILHLLIHTSEKESPITVEAAVVRNLWRNRVGIEFLHLKTIERNRLQKVIHNLLDQQKNRPIDPKVKRQTSQQLTTGQKP